MEGRRDHVGGEQVREPLPQVLGPHRTLARAEGGQLAAVPFRSGHHDRAVRDAGHPQQRVLHLADLDPEPPYLDLRVRAAEELQFSVGPPAAEVASAVEPLAGAVGVFQIGERGAFGVVDVAAPDAHPGEDDGAGRAERHRTQVLVDDVLVHVGDGPAERDPVGGGRPVHHLVVGVVGGLGQSVGVDQSHGGSAGEPPLDQLTAQRLAGDGDAPQVRQVPGDAFQRGQDDVEIGRHQLQDVDAFLGDPVQEPVHVEDGVLLDQQGPPACQQPGEQLPQRDVEALRGRLRHHGALAYAQIVDLGVQVVEQAGVLAQRALRLSGGAGGEEDVREPVRRDVQAEVRSVAGPVGEVRDEQPPGSGERGERPVQPSGAAGCGEHVRAVGAGEHRADAAGRVMRVDGQVHAAGLEDAEHAGRPVEVALGHDGDRVLRAEPLGQQGAGHPVGPGVEVRVRQAAALVDHGDGVRMPAHPFLEQFVEPAVRQRTTRPRRQPVELEPEFVRGQQAAPVVRGVGVVGDRLQRGAVVSPDPGGTVRVQQVRPVPQAQHEPAAILTH